MKQTESNIAPREAVYDRYSFGIGIGRYIGFTDKGNVLSVSL